MQAKKILLSAAITAAVAGYMASAQAEEKKSDMEKCYGIAKAGKNDCTGGGVSTCAGHSKKDGEGFLLLPKGACERITGGSTKESK